MGPDGRKSGTIIECCVQEVVEEKTKNSVSYKMSGSQQPVASVIASPVALPMVPASSNPPARSNSTIVFVIMLIIVVVIVVFLITKLNTMNNKIKDMQGELDTLSKTKKLIEAMAMRYGLRQNDQGEVEQISEDGEDGDGEEEDDGEDEEADDECDEKRPCPDGSCRMESKYVCQGDRIRQGERLDLGKGIHLRMGPPMSFDPMSLFAAAMGGGVDGPQAESGMGRAQPQTGVQVEDGPTDGVGSAASSGSASAAGASVSGPTSGPASVD
jgi:competence protein ComGC